MIFLVVQFAFHILFSCLEADNAVINQPSSTMLSLTAEKINTIPPSELRNIRELFQELFLRETFSYTLFSDKPLSISDLALKYEYAPQSFDEQCTAIFNWTAIEAPVFTELWKSWKDVAYLFPSPNFLFIQKKMGSSIRVILLNIPKFHETVTLHQSIFKCALGDQATPEWLLAQIASEKVDLWELLQYRQDLMGLLLGFGLHNPTLFQERQRLANIHLFRPGEQKRLTNKLIALDSLLEGIGSYEYSPVLLGEVYFAGDPSHPETMVLKNKYRSLRHKLSEKFAKKDIVETILNRIQI